MNNCISQGQNIGFISVFFVNLGDLFLIAVGKKKIPSVLDSCSQEALYSIAGDMESGQIKYNTGSFL